MATFNVEELSRAKVDSVGPDGRGLDSQLRAAAAVIQRVRPDLMLLNEVDLGQEGEPDAVVRDFQDRYLAVGPDSLRFSHVFVAPSNTGVPTGLDLDGDGVVAGPQDLGGQDYGDDAFGFGVYPGQYAMAILSRFPVDTAGARTFQRFLWRDLPGNHLPVGFYSDTAVAVLRLSSKSHWDVPVRVDGRVLHVLASHPTPPVFDGPENRNGRRNFDEIGFWARYLTDGRALYDDRGRRGGYGSDAPFVLLGDMNAAPAGGDATLGDTAAISQILALPRIQDPPMLQGRPTAEFGGGMRVDYVLPSRGLGVVDGGVFWPDATEDPAGAAVADRASDHRLVWLDLRLGEG